MRKIKPGQTVRVKPGQWLVEEQDEVHHARNAGTVPIVIYLATLLRTGEPAAILSETQSRPVLTALSELALSSLGARPFHVIVPTPPQRARSCSTC